jgi:hypothetical protein
MRSGLDVRTIIKSVMTANGEHHHPECHIPRQSMTLFVLCRILSGKMAAEISNGGIL